MCAARIALGFCVVNFGELIYFSCFFLVLYRTLKVDSEYWDKITTIKHMIKVRVCVRALFNIVARAQNNIRGGVGGHREPCDLPSNLVTSQIMQTRALETSTDLLLGRNPLLMLLLASLPRQPDVHKAIFALDSTSDLQLYFNAECGCLANGHPPNTSRRRSMILCILSPSSLLPTGHHKYAPVATSRTSHYRTSCDPAYICPHTALKHRRISSASRHPFANKDF